MSKKVVDFWKAQAIQSETSIRWTPLEMLFTDKKILEGIINAWERSNPINWLDVGAGSGDLQKALLGKFGFCLATDAEQTMIKFFEGISNVAFLPSGLEALKGVGDFGLVTAFGLVTYLEQEEEEELYLTLSRYTVNGTVVVKNQVTEGKSKRVETFSEQFQMEYFGRYPNLEEQKARLEKQFGEVKVLEYPDELNIHLDTRHVAFVCKK